MRPISPFVPIAALFLAAPSIAAPVTLPSGTIVEDVKVGTGEPAQRDAAVTVHYTGWLYVGGKRGKKFDSSHDHDVFGGGGEPFSFQLGAGEVIKGWDEGVEGMREGGIRTLIIPPAAGYGPQGDDVIPPNSWLIFDIELIRSR